MTVISINKILILGTNDIINLVYYSNLHLVIHFKRYYRQFCYYDLIIA